MKNIEKYKDDVLDKLDACSLDARLRRKMVNGYCEGFNCGGCRERVLKWLLEECKDPVLDEVERKYLSEVIRPFRKKITCISKVNHYGVGKQYICVETKDKDGFLDSLNFPDFENDTMYKGMRVDRRYTLKELGL
jgi:hypothetical protein